MHVVPPSFRFRQSHNHIYFLIDDVGSGIWIVPDVHVLCSVWTACILNVWLFFFQCSCCKLIKPNMQSKPQVLQCACPNNFSLVTGFIVHMLSECGSVGEVVAQNVEEAWHFVNAHIGERNTQTNIHEQRPAPCLHISCLLGTASSKVVYM